jgi:hypothetical protein
MIIMLKGISLAVDTVIIILAAALVLSLVTVFFISSSSQTTSSIDHTTAWARGCSSVKADNCPSAKFEAGGHTIKGYDPDGDGSDNDLFTACRNFFGSDASAEQCRERCCGTGSSQNCAGKSEADCTGNCQWNPRSGTCG